jgi:hypothetical protein
VVSKKTPPVDPNFRCRDFRINLTTLRIATGCPIVLETGAAKSSNPSLEAGYQHVQSLFEADFGRHRQVMFEPVEGLFG